MCLFWRKIELQQKQQRLKSGEQDQLEHVKVVSLKWSSCSHNEGEMLPEL